MTVAVGELHLVAGAPPQNFGRGQDPRRPSVGAEQVLAGLDLAHGGPAGRGRQRGVQRQGLAHARSRSYDDHLAGVQAVGEDVEVGEAGRDAGEDSAVAADGLDLVQGAGHDLGQRVVVLAGPALGDGVHLGLGPVHELVGVRVARVAELHDPGARLDQAAQDRALLDDAGVVAGVGRGRHRGDERVQVRGAADPGDLAAPGELVGDGDGVGRLAPAVQVEDGLVDELVRRPVVVGGPDHLDHVRDGILGQQHPAEDALFRRDVVRRSPLEVVAPRSNLGDAHLSLLPRTSERGTNARLLGPDSVVADGSDIFARRHAEHQSPGGRRCGQGVQTRRPRCAQPGEIPVEMAGGNTDSTLLAAQMWSTGCVEEKPSRQFSGRKSTAAIHSCTVTNCG